ncbi:hypothetical protein [Methylobacterium sp. JK268]
MSLKRLLSLGALALTPVLSACVLDGGSTRDLATSAGLVAKPVEAPDFVAQSRREGIDYLPVGVSAPARPIRARSAAGTESLAKDLDASRRRNESRGREAAKVGAAAKPPE